ncbi:hypothetical protein RRG08_037069 [Elysia crispata]|uniref:Uncharacterized protein n=1 Tax=Elysia crispata TaxID=231223 RepID=A0AAE1DP42_9GAST|nr:hypothetical protein RRG08_037069 [Elysia crispata]
MLVKVDWTVSYIHSSKQAQNDLIRSDYPWKCPSNALCKGRKNPSQSRPIIIRLGNIASRAAKVGHQGQAVHTPGKRLREIQVRRREPQPAGSR